MAHLQNKISQGNIALKISSTKQNLAEMMEKEVFVESLQTTLKAKNTEIEKTKLDLKELNEKYKQTLLNYSAYKVKYYQIEEDNAKYVTTLRNQMEEFKENVKRHEHLKDELLKQLNEEKMKYQQLYDKSLCQAERIKKFESQLLQNSVDADNVKRTYELHLQSAQEKTNEEINNLRIEMEKAKKELQGIIAAKESMIYEKCKIITEQSYKMREIERVFGRPTTCVSALTVDTNKENESKCQSNENKCQSESSSKNSPTTKSVVHNTNEENVRRHLMTKITRKRRLILRPNPSPLNVINVDNEEDDYDNNNDSDYNSNDILRPYRANSTIYNKNRVTRSNFSSKQSTPTNASDVFDIIKRSKK